MGLFDRGQLQFHRHLAGLYVSIQVVQVLGLRSQWTMGSSMSLLRCDTVHRKQRYAWTQASHTSY